MLFKGGEQHVKHLRFICTCPLPFFFLPLFIIQLRNTETKRERESASTINSTILASVLGLKSLTYIICVISHRFVVGGNGFVELLREPERFRQLLHLQSATKHKIDCV